MSNDYIFDDVLRVLETVEELSMDKIIKVGKGKSIKFNAKKMIR